MNWPKRRSPTQNESAPFKTMAQMLAEEGRRRAAGKETSLPVTPPSPENIPAAGLPPVTPASA